MNTQDPTDWTAVENALQEAAVVASGLPGNRVRWGSQSRDIAPTAGDLLILEHGAEVGDALPAILTPDNPSPAPGAEILLGTTEQVDFEWSLDYYSMTSTGAGAAQAVLSRIIRRLSLETVQEILDGAGVAIYAIGTPQHLPAVFETSIRNRSRVVVQCRVTDGASEPSTFIETPVWVGTFTP
jgi:hypothetical protein